jgi:hypothetical protein
MSEENKIKLHCLQRTEKQIEQSRQLGLSNKGKKYGTYSEERKAKGRGLRGPQKNPFGPRGPQGSTSEETKEKSRQSRGNFTGKNKTQFERKLKSAYSLTLEEYNKLVSEQSGRCAICGNKTSKKGLRLTVDHNHKTGIVRGLLCYKCNMALGLLNDSEELLVNAISYLTN